MDFGVRSLDNTYESMYARTRELLEAGRAEPALDLLRRIVKRLSSLSDETLRSRDDLSQMGLVAGLDLATLLSNTGRYDEAVASLDGLDRFSPEREEAIANFRARLRAQQGHLAQARDELAALAERFPQDPAHWVALAQVTFSMGDLDQAEDLYRRALELVSDDMGRADIHLDLFALEAQRGRKAEALAEWDQAMEADSNFALRNARDLYTYLLRIDDRTTLRRYLDQDVSRIRQEFYRGILARRAGDFSEGDKHWQRLTKESPLADSLGKVEWAETALRLGGLDAAISILMTDRARLASPHVALILATAMAQSGNVEAARDLLHTGIYRLQRRVPRRDSYGQEDWELLTSVVEKRALWSQFREFFALEDSA